MITIPFHQHNGYVGGIVTFMQNLQTYLGAHGYPYTETLQTASTLFFPVKHDLHSVAIFKKAGGRIIQRLDGVYYPQKHAEQYETLNQNTKEIYQRYVDYVIFQSDYSEAQCAAMFGEKPAAMCETIYNGVEKSVFFPDATASWASSATMKFITTGGFRNIDMLEPVMLALDELSLTMPLELTVVGPIQNDRLRPLLERSYVTWVGEQEKEAIAVLLRQHHIFLYSHLNPPCPNSVLEAISTGLPIVGFDSGAMRELCHFSKDLLAHVSDDVFQDYRDFDPRKLRDKISLAVAEYPAYRERALAHSHLYSFEETGAAYVQVFDQIQEEAKKTFSPRRYQRLKKQYELESRARRWYGTIKNKLLGKP